MPRLRCSCRSSSASMSACPSAMSRCRRAGMSPPRTPRSCIRGAMTIRLVPGAVQRGRARCLRRSTQAAVRCRPGTVTSYESSDRYERQAWNGPGSPARLRASSTRYGPGQGLGVFRPLLAAFFACLILFGSAHAEEAYQADPKLVAAAQKEGEVVLYTTLIVDQAVRPMIKAFRR